MALHSLDHLRAATQIKNGIAFASIPNVIPHSSQNLAPTNLAPQLINLGDIKSQPALTPMNTKKED